MPDVRILLGSTSDEPVMSECVRYLDWFGVSNEMIVASAHRDPIKAAELSTNAEEDGVKVLIAAAGMAAALPGVVAAHSTLPVLGVPLEGGLPGGIDALYSIVQMPPGIPVGTLAVGKAGARNAAVLAVRILRLMNPSLGEKLTEFQKLGFRL